MNSHFLRLFSPFRLPCKSRLFNILTVRLLFSPPLPLPASPPYLPSSPLLPPPSPPGKRMNSSSSASFIICGMSFIRPFSSPFSSCRTRKLILPNPSPLHPFYEKMVGAFPILMPPHFISTCTERLPPPFPSVFPPFEAPPFPPPFSGKLVFSRAPFTTYFQRPVSSSSPLNNGRLKSPEASFLSFPKKKEFLLPQ